MYIIICAALGLLTLAYFLKRYQRDIKTIPGPKGLPLVGIGLEITQGSFHEKLSEYAKTYGDVYRLNIFGNNLIVLNSQDLVRKAFNNEHYKRVMNDRSSTFYGEKILFGSQSIAFLENAYGSVHGNLRRGFTQAMHVYGEGRIEFENKVQKELGNLVNNITNENGKEFDFMYYIKLSLTNILASVLGGHDMDVEEDFRMFWMFDEGNNFFLNQQVDSIMRMFPFMRYVPSIYKQKYEAMTSAKEAITKKYFHDIKVSHSHGEVRGLIDYLIEEQLKAEENGDAAMLFTDERIMSMLLETIAAGMLTTTSTISSLFLCLINHPEYQTKMQEELDAVIGRDRRPTFADKPNCPFNEAVYLETLRYLPAAPLLIPHYCKQDVNFEGYDIQANSQIVPNCWFIQHDEKIWGDPWTFRPERFLDDKGELLPVDHPLRRNWLPFGTGRRHCVGESFARSRSFLYISTLLQRWTFSMDPDKLVSCDPRKGAFKFALLCMPDHYKCKATPRD